MLDQVILTACPRSTVEGLAVIFAVTAPPLPPPLLPPPQATNPTINPLISVNTELFLIIDRLRVLGTPY
ncbi:MAG: hypothetical protein WCB11_30420 [Terriglobales bacterium]